MILRAVIISVNFIAISAATMRFAVVATFLAVIASAGATVLVERQVGASNPNACLTITSPLTGTRELITCSVGTCTPTGTTTEALLGQTITFTVGVSILASD